MIKRLYNCSQTQTVLRLKTCSSTYGEGVVYVYKVLCFSIISGTVVLVIRQIQFEIGETSDLTDRQLTDCLINRCFAMVT
jgi:hypothetical protein